MIRNSKTMVEVNLYSPLQNNKFIKIVIMPKMYFEEDVYLDPISHNFEYLFKFGPDKVEKSTPDEVIEEVIKSLKLSIRSPHLCKPAIKSIIDYSLDPIFKEYLKLTYAI
jgi:hypothetical protein